MTGYPHLKKIIFFLLFCATIIGLFLFYNYHSSAGYNELIQSAERSDSSYDQKHSSLNDALKLAIQNENNDHIMEARLLLGHLYLEQNLYDSSFYFFQDANKLTLLLDNQNKQFETFYYMALCEEYQYHLDSALSFYEMALEIAQKGRNQIDMSSALEGISIVYMTKKDFNKSESYFLQLAEIYKAENDSLGIANTLNNLGLISQWTGNYAISINYLKEAQNIYHFIEPENYASTNLNIGIVYKRIGDYTEAIKFGIKALAVFDSLGMQNELAATYNLLGNTFLELNNFNKARSYHNQALTIRKKIADSSGLGSSYTNLGNIESRLNEHHHAIELYQQSLSIQNSLQDYTQIGLNLNNIGLAFLQLGNYSQAETSFTKSISIKRKIGDQKGLGMTFNHLSELYLLQNELSKSKSFLDSAMHYIQKTGALDLLMENYMQQISYFKETNNLQSLMPIYESLMALKDTIFNRSNQQVVAEVQAKYETEKLNRRSKELELNNYQTETKLKLSRYYLMVFIIGSFLLTLTTILLIVIYRGKKASEQHTKQLYRELNHRISNSLSSFINLLRLQSQFAPPELKTTLIDNESRMEALNLVHNLLYQRYQSTGVNSKIYFNTLLANLLFSFTQEPNRVSLDTDLKEVLLSADQIIPIGLIVNELVMNALKHAFNDCPNPKLTVILDSPKAQVLEIRIEDNGIGISNHPNSIAKKGFGHELVNSLILQLKGSIKCPEKQNGTFWIVEIPIK